MSGQSSPLAGVELVVSLVAAEVALAMLAERLATPRPVVLALGGLLLGLVWHAVPGMPDAQVVPDQVLTIFLPPVLAWAAFNLPLGAFRANLRAIVALAVVLVFVTMALVAAVTRALDPAIPWAAALALGAIVAPPDPVAATSVGGQLGLRDRVVTILEGEGLANDAVAIVAYELAVAAAVSGTFSWAHVGVELLRTAPLGVAMGLGVGWASAAVRRRIDDPVLETTISLVVPYVAYVAADWAGGSAVLSVVTLGFLLRRRVLGIGNPPTRLASRTVWRTLNFIVTGLVFLLIGIELGRTSAWVLAPGVLWRGALVSAVVVLVRLAWMHVVPRLVHAVAGASEPDADRTSGAELTVLGWAGMRGVVSLALALALPARTASGAPFPGRAQLVLLSFIVIFVTLVGQGLTLAPLIRWLGAGDPARAAREEAAARRLAVSAAQRRLAELPDARALHPDVRAHVSERVARDIGLARDTDADADAAERGRVRRLLGQAIDAERDVVLALRDAGRLDDDTAQRLETDLDVEQVRLRDTARRLTDA